MKNNGTNRVVVTGLGVISSIGLDQETFFANARKGLIGIHEVHGFDVSRMSSDRGGEITDFDILKIFPDSPTLSNLGRAKQMALAAAKQCIDDSGFEMKADPFSVGVAVGYTQGESKIMENATDQVEQGGMDDISFLEFSNYGPFSIPQKVALHFAAWGPNLAIGNACAAGNFAIGQALDYIRNGEATAMITGGADAFSRYGYSGFARLGAISPDVPRPFSRDRAGMVPAEGAGMLFLEALESAKRRGAHIYCEVVGYGESCDASHITQPDPGGIGRAIHQALDSAGLTPDCVSYISVHGTGTQANDLEESAALRGVFGDEIPPLSSLKSMIGHAMSASSVIECVASILTIQNQFLLPTMNFHEPDDRCQVDCIPNEGRDARVNLVLKTASAFGGSNAAVLFQEFKEGE